MRSHLLVAPTEYQPVDKVFFSLVDREVQELKIVTCMRSFPHKLTRPLNLWQGGIQSIKCYLYTHDDANFDALSNATFAARVN